MIRITRQDGWQSAAMAFLLLAVVSFLSPQVGELGRGLYTSLPALVIAAFCIYQASPQAFAKAFARFWVAYLLGFLFLLQAGVRFAYAEDAANLWHTFFLGPCFILLFLLWIGAYAELGEEAVRRFRRGLLVTWCLSLALGLPALIANPGVARTTMGNPFASENAATWAPQGVGEYDDYTTLAVCFLPILATALGMKGFARIAGLLLVLLAGASVILSTFTMAAFLLAVSLLAAFLVWVRNGKGWSRLWRSASVLLALGVVLLLYAEARELPQTERIVLKIERLFTGVSSSGLASGDETGRGQMFTEEIQAFSEEPFLGYIPLHTGQRGNGHSSLSNSLVLFGLFGALLWFGALWRIFLVSFRDTAGRARRDTVIFCWFALVLGGILNPLWHSTEALLCLFAFTLPARHGDSAVADLALPGEAFTLPADIRSGSVVEP